MNGNIPGDLRIFYVHGYDLVRLCGNVTVLPSLIYRVPKPVWSNLYKTLLISAWYPNTRHPLCVLSVDGSGNSYVTVRSLVVVLQVGSEGGRPVNVYHHSRQCLERLNDCYTTTPGTSVFPSHRRELVTFGLTVLIVLRSIPTLPSVGRPYGRLSIPPHIVLCRKHLYILFNSNN